VPGSRLFLSAYVGTLADLYTATGSANTNTLRWSASFGGVAFAHGSALQFHGALGPATVAYAPTTDTNTYPSGYIPQVVEFAIQNMTNYAGRVYGQQVLQKQMQGVSVWPAPPGP
jgi:hypothetical protein